MTSERVAAHVATVGVIAVLALFIWVSLAWSHEWYDTYCCSESDCAPYLGQVEVRPDGFWIPAFNHLVPFKDARYNMPGDDPHTYHLCEFPKGTVRCFYVRPGGV